MNNLNSPISKDLSNDELPKPEFLSLEPDKQTSPPFLNIIDSYLGRISFQDVISQISSLPAHLYELTQNFIVLELLGLILGTPGSDAFVLGRAEKNDTLLTRQGKDVLLAVDPAADQPGQGEIDILAGDLDIFELFPLPGRPPLEENPRSWQDRFILGDERQPYYIGSGADDYALILDFDPELDILQLHGTPEDYQAIASSNDTKIYWQQAGELDLVASLPGVSDLSLTEDYFLFDDPPSEEPVLEEVEQFGTSGADLSVGIASANTSNAVETTENLDAVESADGSVYVTGVSGDSFWVAKYDRNGELDWLESSPSTGNLDTDNLGNVYVGGGLGDVEIAKYDSEGEQQWTQSLGTFSLDNSFNLDVDDFGNVYLTGYTLGDLGGENAGELAVGPFPIFTTDAWIAKYDTDGNQLWLEQFGSGDFDEAFAIATDSNGNAYTSGWTLGDLAEPNAGLYDIWVAKNDSDGNQQWLKQFGSEDYDWSWDAATDSEDNVYVTGWTLGDLGETNFGSYDAWVAKYDSNGDRQWLKQFGTAGDDIARSIDFDDSGNFYLTGYTDRDLAGANAGSYDIWVAKYDRDGNQQWQQQFGTSEIDNPFELTVNSEGRVFVTGFTEGSLGAVNAGSYDPWLAELSSADGSLLNFGNNGVDNLL
ncbi:SBBP repeat-containing protein [Myxosarcina sp. GI1(2024)]